MARSHYCGGTVWGRVVEARMSKSGRGTPYLVVLVDCSGTRGNVRAYGRIWGKNRIDSFLSHYKRTPNASYRFRGFFSQYEKDGQVLSNYTFFDWAEAPGEEARAAFVLRGEVVDVDELCGVVRIRVAIDGANGGRPQEETFSVWASDFSRAVPGELVEAKGYLQQGDGADEFGDAIGPIRPVAKVLSPLPPF